MEVPKKLDDIDLLSGVGVGQKVNEIIDYLTAITSHNKE